MTDAPLLSVRSLVKQYPGVRALDGVDFDVHAGEVHCLIGQNGAGKSTLTKCISGVAEPTDGEVLVDGRPLPVGDPQGSIDRGIATIYQELDLVPDLPVAHNVFLGHEPRRFRLLDRAAMRRATRELLERLKHGHLDPDAITGRLAPAEQQIVSICRALSRDVRLLIMDEPSAVLDEHEVEALFRTVDRLAAEGVGVIYISHRLDEVVRVGDRVTVLKDGRSVASGLPADTDQDRLVTLMVGRDVGELYPDRGEQPGEVLLEVRGLCAPRVRDVSLRVAAGEVVGLAGLVGSGRSQILHAIYGLDTRTAGSVEVGGRALPPGRPDLAVQAGLGLAPEERKSQALLLEWDLIKNVTLADLGDYVRGGLLDRSAERAAAHEQLRALRTAPDDPARLAGELSGGNQQKVVLARWLLRDCRVLLLDEPTRGIDVGAKSEIFTVIRDLARAGLGVLMVSSELPELTGFCDRILVVRDGEVVAEGRGDELTEEEILHHCVRGSREAA